MRTVLIAPVLFVLAARADAAPPDPWTAKPVFVARTLAVVYDISADGTCFLLSDGSALVAFDRAAGKQLWRVNDAATHDAKFAPDGKTVAVGAWQHGLNFYDAETGKKLHTVEPGEERPWQVHFRADGTLLYSTSASSFSASPPWTLKYSTIHYDPKAKRQLNKHSDSATYNSTNPWTWHRGAGFFMEFQQEFGANVATRRIVNYTDPMTGKKSPTVEIDVNATPLDLSPDAKVLLTLIAGDQPRLLDTATGKTKFALGDHKRPATDGAYSRDGKLVATVTGTSSRYATRGTYNSNGKVPSGPAEYVVWDAATGKEIARAEFPTKEFDFVRVQFSPDSKYLLLTTHEGPTGKGQAHYAVGAVPFKSDGGAVLTFPRDEAAKPKPPPPPGALVSDPLDRLTEELAKSNKSVNEKVDAMYLAALGRFATEREQKWVRAAYGEKLTADVLRKLLAEIAKSPEFEAHLKSLQKRVPLQPFAPSLPGGTFPPFGGQPFGTPPFGSQPFGTKP